VKRLKESLMPLIYGDQLVMHHFSFRMFDTVVQQASIIPLAKILFTLVIIFSDRWNKIQ
jgi:hypothetical protein